MINPETYVTVESGILDMESLTRISDRTFSRDLKLEFTCRKVVASGYAKDVSYFLSVANNTSIEEAELLILASVDPLKAIAVSEQPINDAELMEHFSDISNDFDAIFNSL